MTSLAAVLAQEGDVVVKPQVEWVAISPLLVLVGGDLLLLTA